MSFKDLNLLPELLRAIEEEGYTTPTSIQEKAIPLILEGKDLLASAETGTGKTAGFTLPMLQRLMSSQKQPTPRALILTPTRELAVQVEENVRTYGKHLPLRSTVIYGGVNMQAQIRNLRRGVDIVVATPGRLLDHVGQRTIDLSKIEIFVLDEADRMLDMGFIIDIRKIMTKISPQRQSLLFSATFSREIKALADGLLKAPIIVETARQQQSAELVTQAIYPVDTRRKKELLSFLISSEKWQQVLVFTRTKHGANRLSEQLEEDGITAIAIHGNKTQAARQKALTAFKKGLFRVLVATDVAARGLDIDHLPHVVNFDLPNVPEDYIHRIGRTGRAGKTGVAISLVSIDERSFLRNIERLLQRNLPTVVVPGYEPDPSIRAQPVLRRGGGGGNRYRAPGGRRPEQSRGDQPRGGPSRGGFRRRGP
jgi:ATP-dependent RNA helicase RhlE